jgi:hypothetical protein
MSDVNGTVVGLQGRDLSSAAPSAGDVLTWDAGNSEWVPQTPPQPLQPWVGSVNTQSQVIQRVPWTCRTTGTAPSSTGVSVTLPTDKAVQLVVSGVFRHPSSVAGCVSTMTQLIVANNGGTLTTPSSTNFSASASGSMSATGNPTYQLSVSGTTVTLEVGFFTAGGGTVVDGQGFVDVVLI